VTVNDTEFTNWQDGRQPGPPLTTCSPALVSLDTYLQKRWGGSNLGCLGSRAVRGGSTWSSHAFGAARDWRYENPGPGRAVLLDEVIPFLIANSAELGIQAIHDYKGGRIWRSNRGDGKGAYWKDQPKSSTGMGQTWAGWVHIEVHAKAWFDGRSVEDKLGGRIVPEATLAFGDKGPEVRWLYDYMQLLGFTKRTPGNVFDRPLVWAVRRMQRKVGFKRADRDGVYDQWTAVAFQHYVEGLTK
jgi:hypothetical protein